MRTGFYSLTTILALVAMSGCADSGIAKDPPQHVAPVAGAETPESASAQPAKANGAKEATAAPTILADPVLDVAYGQYFTYPIKATGDPMGFAVTNPPAWLKREGNQLSGYPNQAGTFEVLLRAVNESGSSEPFRLEIRVGPAPTQD